MCIFPRERLHLFVLTWKRERRKCWSLPLLLVLKVPRLKCWDKPTQSTKVQTDVHSRKTSSCKFWTLVFMYLAHAFSFTLTQGKTDTSFTLRFPCNSTKATPVASQATRKLCLLARSYSHHGTAIQVLCSESCENLHPVKGSLICCLKYCRTSPRNTLTLCHSQK